MRIRPVAVLLLFIIILGVVGVWAGLPILFHKKTHKAANNLPIEISGPIEISKPGYYQLTQDIVPMGEGSLVYADEDCIHIYSSGVVLDGMGHTLDGKNIQEFRRGSDSYSPAYVTTGIDIHVNKEDWVSDVIIRNITLRNWYWGIAISHGENIEIQDINATDNDEGIRLYRTSGAVIQNSNINNNVDYGIEGLGTENITIINNTIRNDRFAGITVDGNFQEFYVWNIFGKFIPVFFLPGDHDQLEISGNGLVIAQNTISDCGNGIVLSEAKSIEVISNTIANTSGGIISSNCNSENVFNNTYFNVEQNSSESNDSPFFIIVGIVFIVLFRGAMGIIEVSLDFITKPLKEKFSVKPESPAGPGHELAGSVFYKKVPAFIRNNLAGLIVGIIILGGAYTYAWSGLRNLFSFEALMLIAAIVIISHEFVHFFMAHRLGLRVDFRVWGTGTIITLLSAGLFREVFGKPVITVIKDEETANPKKIALLMLAGPPVSLILALVFYLLYLMPGTSSSLALFGVNMILMTAFVSFLPVADLDGKYVWKWNKAAWVAAFLPVYFTYTYLFIYSDLLILTIPVVAGVVGMGLWHLIKTFYTKSTPVISKWVRHLFISIVVFIIAHIVNLLFAGCNAGSWGEQCSTYEINNLISQVAVMAELGSLIAIVTLSGAIVREIYRNR
jgi:hypothetical protein